MHTPQANRFRPTIAALLLTVCFGLASFAQTAPAQQQPPPQSAELERGVELYRRGDFKGAAKALRDAVKKGSKTDPRAWLYLGQALMWRGEVRDARKAMEGALALDPNSAGARGSLAFLHLNAGRIRDAEREAELALALDPNHVDAHYVIGSIRLREGAWLKALERADRIIKIDDKTALAYALKSEALLGVHERALAIVSEETRGVYDYDPATVTEARSAGAARLREAADNLEKYLALAPKAPDAALLREQLETLRAYSEADPARKIYRQGELTSKAIITAKPEPGFTEEARRAGISGVVRLRAVLAADGTVKHIYVVRGLGYGLTQQAVSAARRMKFKPATVAGSPVSQFVILEYNFNIY